MSEGAVAVVSPDALVHNLGRVRASVPGCPVLAVIKANAYGHGLAEVAGLLADAEGFAVARIEEAIQLREAGIGRRIVILGGCATAAELATASAAGLDVVVHSPEQVALVAGLRTEKPVRCWLKIDTGMGRLGIAAGDARALAGQLSACSGVAEVVLMTHLACADEAADTLNESQLNAFAACLGDWTGDLSFANSAAILQWPELTVPLRSAAAGLRNWVRPGIMLYGASPIRGVSGRSLGLRPAMSFETRLISVKRVPAGTRVGYGGHWVAPRDSVLGVAAAGYADGYPWYAPSGTPVGVRGRIVPLVGRVSMDMITVDLTDLPAAVPGDRVVLWGDSPTVEDVAAAAGTIPWTIMTGISRRVGLRLAPEEVATTALQG